MRIYFHIKNEYFWELMHRDISVKSKLFKNTDEIADNLESTMNAFEESPIERTDKTVFVFFEFADINDKWQWTAYSECFSDELIMLEERNDFSSYEKAYDSAYWFKDSIIKSPVFYSSGLPVPFSSLSGKFQDRAFSEDTHPIMKHIKK